MTNEEIIKNLSPDRLSAVFDSNEEMQKYAAEIGEPIEKVTSAVCEYITKFNVDGKHTVKFPSFVDGYSGLMFLLMTAFIAPYTNNAPLSKEKKAKAKELAKAAKAAMDKGERFEIKEGTELYEDTELFNDYTTELSKIIMIERVNAETAKISESKHTNL